MRRTEAAHDEVSGPAGRARLVVAIAAIVASLAVLLPLYVYLASEALVLRRYPLTSTTARAELKPKQILRGAHLIAIAGCADCHGASLQGRLMQANASLPVYAGNLLRDAQTMSDGEIERAIRYAIKPDATSMWVMPSGSYAYMSEDDVSAIMSALRSRPAVGVVHPSPRFDWSARWALLTHKLKPAVLAAADSPASLDIGPRYDGGRYLSRMTCGECHGTDLKGLGYAPNLKAISHYNRPAFFALLREGRGVNGRMLPAMYRLARVRFHAFADYEIMALYDYLDARARAPAEFVARAEALRKHEEDEKRLNDANQ